MDPAMAVFSSEQAIQAGQLEHALKHQREARIHVEYHIEQLQAELQRLQVDAARERELRQRVDHDRMQQMQLTSQLQEMFSKLQKQKQSVDDQKQRSRIAQLRCHTAQQTANDLRQELQQLIAAAMELERTVDELTMAKTLLQRDRAQEDEFRRRLQQLIESEVCARSEFNEVAATIRECQSNRDAEWAYDQHADGDWQSKADGDGGYGVTQQQTVDGRWDGDGGYGVRQQQTVDGRWDGDEGWWQDEWGQWQQGAAEWPSEVQSQDGWQQDGWYQDESGQWLQSQQPVPESHRQSEAESHVPGGGGPWCVPGGGGPWCVPGGGGPWHPHSKSEELDSGSATVAHAATAAMPHSQHGQRCSDERPLANRAATSTPDAALHNWGDVPSLSGWRDGSSSVRVGSILGVAATLKTDVVTIMRHIETTNKLRDLLQVGDVEELVPHCDELQSLQKHMGAAMSLCSEVMELADDSGSAVELRSRIEQLRQMLRGPIQLKV